MPEPSIQRWAESRRQRWAASEINARNTHPANELLLDHGAHRPRNGIRREQAWQLNESRAGQAAGERRLDAQANCLARSGSRGDAITEAIDGRVQASLARRTHHLEGSTFGTAST